MKKSHIWETIEILQVQCPYCRKEIEEEGCFEERDIINCQYCYKDFELGEQG